MNAPATPPEAPEAQPSADSGFQPQPPVPVLADVVDESAAPQAPAQAAEAAQASEPAPEPVQEPAGPSPLDQLAAAVLDAAELANRGAQAAASVSGDLHKATAALQATQSRVQKQSYIVMGIVCTVTLLAIMFIVVTGIRINSRINQLDATLLAVAQRAVALNEGLGSIESINESVGKVALQVEILARTTGELGNRIDQTVKQSETVASQIPAKTAEQVAAGNQNLARQFEAMNARLQAQATAVQGLARELQALKGTVGNVDKLNRDVQSLVTLQRERYLEAVQKAAPPAGQAPSAAPERERDRALQYPRVQPPVSPNATPSTVNSNGAIVVPPPRSN